jgi:hypothetical protein
MNTVQLRAQLVISADPHPVNGMVTFSIGAPGHAAGIRPAHASRAVGIAFGLARFERHTRAPLSEAAVGSSPRRGGEVAFRQAVRASLDDHTANPGRQDDRPSDAQ